MSKKARKAYFYPKLYGLRHEFGYSLDDMAKYLGISKDCYFRKEKGKTDFYLWEARKILEIFNVTFSDIFFTNDVNQSVNKKK